MSKTNFKIELPLKPHDTVYILEHRFPSKIYEIAITKDNIYFRYEEIDEGYECDELWDEGEFELKDIGKTVFFTLEEIESYEKNNGLNQWNEQQFEDYWELEI